MFDIGFWELLVIGVIGLLVLGPERLPGAIRSTSRTIRNIKNMANGFKQEIEQQVRIQELHENLKKAEQQQLKNLSPELQESVDELKSAAESVNKPYQKSEQKGQFANIPNISSVKETSENPDDIAALEAQMSSASSSSAEASDDPHHMAVDPVPESSANGATSNVVSSPIPQQPAADGTSSH